MKTLTKILDDLNTDAAITAYGSIAYNCAMSMIAQLNMHFMQEAKQIASDQEAGKPGIDTFNDLKDIDDGEDYLQQVRNLQGIDQMTPIQLAKLRAKVRDYAARETKRLINGDPTAEWQLPKRFKDIVDAQLKRSPKPNAEQKARIDKAVAEKRCTFEQGEAAIMAAAARNHEQLLANREKIVTLAASFSDVGSEEDMDALPVTVQMQLLQAVLRGLEGQQRMSFDRWLARGKVEDQSRSDLMTAEVDRMKQAISEFVKESQLSEAA